MSWGLFERVLDLRFSRRRALSNLAKLAGATALSFIAGGLIGYSFSPRKGIMSTITETKTFTKTVYLTQTLTATKTETVTRTITEKPTIIIEAKIGKAYVKSASDVEISIKLYTDEKFDSIKGRYWNSSIGGELNFREFSNSYEASFLTGQEPGDQFIEFEVERDGVGAGKRLSISVGLSDEEIESSLIGRRGIEMLWRDLLENGPSSDLEILERILRLENELVNEVQVEEVSEASALYLRNLSNYLISNSKSSDEILKGLAIILPAINVYPQIVYGNWVEDFDRAEFLIDGYRACLLYTSPSPRDRG